VPLPFAFFRSKEKAPQSTFLANMSTKHQFPASRSDMDIIPWQNKPKLSCTRQYICQYRARGQSGCLSYHVHIPPPRPLWEGNVPSLGLINIQCLLDVHRGSDRQPNCPRARYWHIYCLVQLSLGLFYYP
jgi:hypothetical protein